MTYWKREALHTTFAVGVTVVVAVAAKLTSVEAFDQTLLTGLVVTAVRTAATAVVTVGAPYVLKLRQP